MAQGMTADLSEHLFAELERLSGAELEGEALSAEIDRAKAVCAVAEKIIDNGSLVIRATGLRAQLGGSVPLNKMLGSGGGR